MLTAENHCHPRHAFAMRICACLYALLCAIWIAGCGYAGSAGTAAQFRAMQIVSQPVSQSVSAGQTVVFTVQVQEPTSVQFQWYANGKEITGATTSTYTMVSPAVSQNGMGLSVKISDAAGYVTSQVATLTVVPAQPVLLFAPIAPATFGDGPLTLMASSASPAPVTYAVRSGPAVLSGSTLTITGAGSVTMIASQAPSANYTAGTATATFTVAQATPVLKLAPIANQVYGAAVAAIATSSSPGAITYSVSPSSLASVQGAVLTATGTGVVTVTATQAGTTNYVPATVSTRFTIGPAAPVLHFASLPAVTFGDAPFTVSATSTSDGTVQYAVLSGPALVTGNQVSVTGAGPVVLSATQAATANFTAAATQTSLDVGSNVTLAAITPANLTLAPGQQTFASTATGGVLNTVSWTASGGSFHGNVWTSPSTAGTYTITATSVDQPARSTSTSVTVSTPVITSEPVPVSLCNAAPFSLSAAAQYASSYQWLLNSAAIPGATAATYSIAHASGNTDTGSYTVMVSNAAGSVTSSAAAVTVGSTITAQPVDSSVPALQVAHFSVTAQGQAPFSYQWFSTTSGAGAGVAIAGATAGTLSVPTTVSADGTKFFATVTDSCGQVLTSNRASLQVLSAPVIITQPQLSAVAVASTPTMQVAVTGDPAVSYQWYWVPSGLHQTTPIAGATSASYTLPSTATTAGNNGDSYYVTVSNTLGQVTSSTVPVLVTSATSTNLWVVGWGASPENAITGSENPGGTAQSFRSMFYPTVSGTMERVHLSNLYNTASVNVGAARLAVATSGSAVDANRGQVLTFNGQTSITLAPGQEVVSDPVQVAYTFGEKLAVSLYVSGSYAALTQHESQVNVNYATPSGAGDTTSDTTGASFTQSNTEWFVLSGVDVYGAYQGTVVLFGSSSIDGHGSNYGDTESYPAFNNPVAGQDNDRPSDWLARQLTAAGYNLGVLNAGTIGNPAGEDARSATGVTVAGIDRFNHDVLQQAGVKTVVIYTGGIDIRGDCVPATNVEATLTNIIAQAYAAGVRVILATLPPAEYCTTVQPLPSTAYPYNGDEFMGPMNPSAENPGSIQRRLLNSWIRTSAPSLPGVVGIADFDSVLADPNHPDFLKPNYTSSDRFHPNGMAYGIQSSAIPLAVVLP